MHDCQEDQLSSGESKSRRKLEALRLPLGQGTMLKLTLNRPSPFAARSTPVPHSEQRLLMTYLYSKRHDEVETQLPCKWHDKAFKGSEASGSLELTSA